MKKVKNLALKYITLFLSIFAKKGELESHNIFIIATGAIGDSLCLSPVFRYIKDSLPDSKITLLVGVSGASVLQGNPFVDQMMIQRRRKIYNLLIFFKIMRTKYSCTIALFCGQRTTSFFCYLASPGAYYGASVREATFFNRIFTDKEMMNVAVLDRPMFVVQKSLMMNDVDKKYGLEVFPQAIHNEYAEKLLTKLDGNRFVYVHIGASQIYRRWHPDFFKILIDWLLKKGFVVLMSGNENEQDDISKIAVTNSNIIPLDMQESILYLAAIISKCEFVVTNDTGPMHIASACKIPSFAFFLRYIFPNTNKPYEDEYKQAYFFSNKSRADTDSYITDISPEEVMSAIDVYLKKNR